MRLNYKPSHVVRAVSLFLESLVLTLPHPPVPSNCGRCMPSTVRSMCSRKIIWLLHIAWLYGIGDVRSGVCCVGVSCTFVVRAQYHNGPSSIHCYHLYSYFCFPLSYDKDVQAEGSWIRNALKVDRPRHVVRRALYQSLTVSVTTASLGVSDGGNIATCGLCQQIMMMYSSESNLVCENLPGGAKSRKNRIAHSNFWNILLQFQHYVSGSAFF